MSRYSLAKIKHCCFPRPRWSSTILCQEKLLSISSQQCWLLTVVFLLFTPYWCSFGPHIQTQAEENLFFFFSSVWKILQVGITCLKNGSNFTGPKSCSLLCQFFLHRHQSPSVTSLASFHSIKETSESQPLCSNWFPVLWSRCISQ